MNPMIETETLNAFVDSELDALASREIETRLERDEALKTRVEAMKQWRRTVQEAAEYHAAPAALQARIEAIAPAHESPASRPRRAEAPACPSPWFAWLGWRPLSGALAVMLVATIGLNTWHERAGADARLQQEVIASHVRATLGEHLVDVASSDHHTVKPWLSSKLDFSPPVPDTALPDTPFIGGRVDYLNGHPVAALVFRHGNHVLNSFVWPVEGPDKELVKTTDRGFQIAHWTHNGMAHWAISDVNPVEFDGIVRKLVAAN